MKIKDNLAKFFSVLRRLRFYEILLLIVALIVIGMWSLMEITRSSVFCGSTCHIMRPYYEEWKTSSHNRVACIECHNPGGTDSRLAPRWSALAQVASYLTRTYGERTRAEVNDAGCLKSDCHSKRLLEGKTAFGGDILFDHGPHLQQLQRGKILRCATCHSQVAMGNHITVQVDTCFICHFRNKEDSPQTAECTLCHGTLEGSVAAFGDRFDHSPYNERGVSCERCHEGIILGNGEVRHELCLGCHDRAVWQGGSEPVEVLHRRHVTDHVIKCRSCHEPIRHAAADTVAEKVGDCSTCHRDKHSGILYMYQGRGARGVPPMPSAMYLSGVRCQGCHVIPGSLGMPGGIPPAGSMKAGPEVCEACHGPGYGVMVKTWRRDLDLAIDGTWADFRETEALIGAISGTSGDVVEARRLLEKARYNFAFVRAAVPVHNNSYALAILTATGSDLERAKTLARKVKDGL